MGGGVGFTGFNQVPVIEGCEDMDPEEIERV